MMNCAILGVLLLGLMAAASAQELDPITNFCRRIDHSSAIKNGTLYINGGLESFKDVNGSNITLGINEYLVKVDLTMSWDWKNTSAMIQAVPKNNTSYERQPPNLSRGALYAGAANDTRLWSYGGTVDPSTNVSFPGYMPTTSNDYALWSYETETGVWQSVEISGDTPFIRPASGAYAEAPQLGLGFYYNGEQNRGSSTESKDLWDTVKFLKGLVVLDFNTGKLKNISTEAVSDLARVRSEMVYIPGIGEMGALVLIGGGEKGAGYLDSNAYGTLVSLGTVDIFDVASMFNESTPDGVWYSQKTTGDIIPDPRMDFCLVAVSAPDGSSHNIYMHGGRGTGETYFDDIFVLSLPSFTWTRVYFGTAYRYGMRCHLGGNRQMITIGGSQEGSWTSNCDWEYRSLAIYDLSATEWGPFFNASAAPYQVPKRVSAVIGGDGNGGATVLQPAAGFTNPNLSVLFTDPIASNSSTTSTATPEATSTASESSSSSNTGAIAGGVIGGLAGIALIGAGILFLRRRRRNADGASSGPLIEAGSAPLYEKDSSVPKVNHELQGDGEFPEGTIPLAEMEGGISTHPPLELPGDSVRDKR